MPAFFRAALPRCVFVLAVGFILLRVRLNEG